MNGDEINSRAMMDNMQRQSPEGFFEKDGEEFLRDFFKEEYDTVPDATKE